ncbi:MAG TPA: hypothetical protein VD907_00360 [Verrucomicrobiae bacterium]|nr:hypothetical protein [Verrucomicrobiae bacterium]
MSEQLTLDFSEFEAPTVKQQSEILPEVVPVRISRIRAQLGARATTAELMDKPYYELGGGVAEAAAEQERDGLTPFIEFLDDYQPYKREAAALFEQFRFHELNEQSLVALPEDQAGPLSAHIVEHIDQMQRRGQVLATEGAFGGALAESYGFQDEASCQAYGRELMALSETVMRQPLFTELTAVAHTFLDEWLQKRRQDPRPHAATNLTRRQFVKYDTAKHGEPHLLATRSNGSTAFTLAYHKNLAA